MSIEPTTNRLLQWILPALAIAVVLFGIFAILDRMQLDGRAAERRALLARGDSLTESALRPGSALSCLDAGAGEATENACEAAIFASPQSAAGAVAYTGARLALLADAQRFDPAFVATFAASRRAIELDRFGLAAHVLAIGNGCSPEHCAAFAFLTDTGVLKGNMKAQAFNQYVSRHADVWNAPAAAAAPPAVSETQPAPGPPSAAIAPASGEPSGRPLPEKYKLPSADSIPAVSIMNKEPPLPQGAAAAQAGPPSDAKPQAEHAVPVPPKRPQAQ